MPDNIRPTQWTAWCLRKPGQLTSMVDSFRVPHTRSQIHTSHRFKQRRKWRPQSRPLHTQNKSSSHLYTQNKMRYKNGQIKQILLLLRPKKQIVICALFFVVCWKYQNTSVTVQVLYILITITSAFLLCTFLKYLDKSPHLFNVAYVCHQELKLSNECLTVFLCLANIDAYCCLMIESIYCLL